MQVINSKHICQEAKICFMNIPASVINIDLNVNMQS